MWIVQAFQKLLTPASLGEDCSVGLGNSISQGLLSQDYSQSFRETQLGGWQGNNSIDRFQNETYLGVSPFRCSPTVAPLK